MLKRGKKRNSGQALTEYVILIMMIAGMGYLLFGPMRKLLAQMEKPLREDFKRVYKYGDPKACGYDDEDSLCSGTPERHPRYQVSGNARMFRRST